MAAEDIITQSLGRIERKVDKSLGKIADMQVEAATDRAHAKKTLDDSLLLKARVTKVETKVNTIDVERTLTRGKILGFLGAWTLFVSAVHAVVAYVTKQ